MTIYKALPVVCSYADEWGATTAANWIEDENARQPKATGLFDKHGTPIYRMPEPIGFVGNKNGRNPR